MFPRFVPSAQPGDITSVTWNTLQWVYTGVGAFYDLDIDASVDIANIFVPQNLHLQLYLSVGSIGWYNVFTSAQTASGTVSIVNSAIFTSSNAFSYTKARFILEVGGVYGTPSAEQII
jgi:hypothetical protein